VLSVLRVEASASRKKIHCPERSDRVQVERAQSNGRLMGNAKLGGNFMDSKE
jgi:hypothetical protein